MVAALPEAVVDDVARADARPAAGPRGTVAVVSAGTSDAPVAAEAALTVRVFGAAVRISDVGVAGLHRVLAVREDCWPPTASSWWPAWKARCPAWSAGSSACR